MDPPLLAPSILAADHSALAENVVEAESLGVKWLHIDVMDGHFVPNLSFGPQTVADLRPKSNLVFDVHLMIDNPDDFIEPFVSAGADRISIHIEPEYDIGKALDRIRDLGAKPGIVLNPRTNLDDIVPYLPSVDLVLAMTVQPGFGGQSFDREVLEKTERLNRLRQSESLEFRIQVDGGINLDTAQLCRNSGVDTFVAGTAFFKASSKAAFLSAIESME